MIEKVLLMMFLIGIIVLVRWLDKKYQLGLGSCSDSYLGSDKRLALENNELRKRVEILERIVTEPAYELNKELAKLRQ